MPDTKSIMTYSVLAPMAYTKIKNIVERNLTSDLVYLPSSIRDMNNPEIEKY
nr:4-hydroxyphenylacetate 3-hydroxylase C-terminal domain-containing protein [Anaerobiospirillum thomasii]